MSFLLDTHVWLRSLGAPTELSPEQRRAIHGASPEDPVLISDISLWEVATLHRLGRVRLALQLREWLDRATGMPQVRRVGISPAVAAEVAALPAAFHRDPADRILVASARVHGATLLTQDRQILASKVVPTLS